MSEIRGSALSAFTLWIDGFIFDLGFVAVDDEPPALMKPALGQNVPNPFNPSTRIEFTLTEPGPVRLTVYDASGGRLRILIDKRRAAGEYSVVWNGRDDAGRRQVSGVYFYRLEVGDTRLERKMVMLK